MNRIEFMTRLEKILKDIPSDERAEALSYYEDYFEDAGKENEEKIISELVSPERVAAIIKAGLKSEDETGETGEFTETGYHDTRFEQKDSPAQRKEREEKEKDAYSYQGSSDKDYSYRNSSDRDYSYQGSTGPRSSNVLKIILVILIALVISPVAVPLLIAAIATVIGIVVAAFGLFAGLAIGAFAMMIAGVVIFIMGIGGILLFFPSAVFACGIGLIVFALGLAATVGTVKLCIIIYPAMFRGIVNIVRWPFHRKVVS